MFTKNLKIIKINLFSYLFFLIKLTKIIHIGVKKPYYHSFDRCPVVALLRFDSPLTIDLFLKLFLPITIESVVIKMKRKVNLYLEEETIQMIRELAHKEDKKQNALIKDMVQAYLILNGKDQNQNRKDDK